MSVRRIMEGTVLPIENLIKDNIAAALADIRTDRPDNFVNTELPASYFIYPKAIGYLTPCIFVIGRNVNFLQARGQNHINAQVAIQVSIVVEEQSAERLTYKCWRYNDALHSILDQAELTSTDGKIKNKIKVVTTEFGDTVQIKSQIESPFRMETMLVLEVEHFEQM
jgi:hypothetical protein